jgi:hypothetical protein
LQATDVRIIDDHVFVSYATIGDSYLGGVEIFNVSDTEHPELISQLLFTDTDVFSLDVNGNKVYLAAARENFEYYNLQSPAIVESVEYTDFQLTTNTKHADLPGFVGKSVLSHGLNIYTTSADNGGLSVLYASNLETVGFSSFEESRDVEIYNNAIYLLNGEPGNLVEIEPDNLIIQHQTALDGARTPDSKSTFEIHDNKLFVSLGEEGVKIMNLDNEEIIESLSRPEIPEDANPSDYVSNALSVDGDYIFIANGAAGLYLAHYTPEDGLSLIGSVGFQSSTNYVQAKDNIIFVATGNGGLKILEMVEYNPDEGNFLTLSDYDEDGVPVNSEGVQDLPGSLFDDLDRALPENRSALKDHPEYFSAVPTSVELSKEADIYVTFLSEGASWTNTLGYYLYNADNPPESPEDIEQLTVIFPNTSEPFSGGNLEPGTTVHLGKIKPNQVVGFFQVARGWSQKLTKGLYTHYSDYETGSPQHSVLLHDQKRNSLIIAFEDIKLPYGDKDFNDVIVKVFSYPEDALKTDALPKIN